MGFGRIFVLILYPWALSRVAKGERGNWISRWRYHFLWALVRQWLAKTCLYNVDIHSLKRIYRYV
jgi:hypothetical protein